MLKVKTHLDKSTIPGAGIGLFATEAISQNAIIWEYNPEYDRAFTQEQYDACDEITRDFLHTYCFAYDSKYYLCVDNSRFFNHSDEPNCYSSDFDKGSLGHTRAKRDIAAGEELTDNYAAFGLVEDDMKFNAEPFDK